MQRGRSCPMREMASFGTVLATRARFRTVHHRAWLHHCAWYGLFVVSEICSIGVKQMIECSRCSRLTDSPFYTCGEPTCRTCTIQNLRASEDVASVDASGDSIIIRDTDGESIVYAPVRLVSELN